MLLHMNHVSNFGQSLPVLLLVMAMLLVARTGQRRTH